MYLLTKKLVLLPCLAAVADANEEEVQNCTGLAMSGGGSNGAWESGVLWGLLHLGNAKDYQYDVVAGVSVGSINASGLALFDKGDEKAAVDFIYDMWKQIDEHSIYKEKSMGMMSGLYEQSVYDTTPGV